MLFLFIFYSVKFGWYAGTQHGARTKCLWDVMSCICRGRRLLRRWLQKSRRDRRRCSDIWDWKTIRWKECTLPLSVCLDSNYTRTSFVVSCH